MFESSPYRTRLRCEALKAAILNSLFVRSRVYWNRDREPGTLSACSLPWCLGVVVACLHPKGKRQFDYNMRIWTFIRNECGDQFSATLDQIRTEAVTEVWIDQQGPNRPAAMVS